MTALVLGTILPWLLIAFGGWLAYQLLLQNGRILLRLELMEKQLTQRATTKRPDAAGLPVGTTAPEFELPDLEGLRHHLSDFRERDILSFPIVMQRQWEISLKYAMFATPIAYLIDEAGILLSDVAVGVEPIVALAGQLREPDEPFLAGRELAWAN